MGMRWSAVAVIAAVQGCAGGTASSGTPSPGPGPAGAAGAEPGAQVASSADLEAIYRARMDSALTRYS